MKISPEQYALTLYDTLQVTKGEETTNLIKQFAEVVAENDDSDKTNEIVEKFEEIWNRRQGIVNVEAISAHGLNEGLIQILKEYIASTTGAKEVKVRQKIDKNILGGVVIKYNDQVLDASLKKGLQDLKKQMKK